MPLKEQQIKDLLNESSVERSVVFGKCLIVSIRLPNGFVIVESSACIDPEDFDVKIGTDICMKRIEDKLWKLEGYRSHNL